ncbi:uncharacterized protein LOC113337027 [Papaver somniferum]|uniref:uncharacterized protein LOC113337027 n=1 Tax=Papaver somniferum TaxID=3469 RepID=UPI000E7000E2|nr:uncharacterized protein LOC113337027 [Papaver somniferum]
MAEVTTTIRQVQIHHLVTLKHTGTNHVLWKAQFKPILKGYDLTGFIDGSKEKPPRTLPESEAVNPAFTAYEHQDSLIVGLLNSTLTPEVLSVVAELETAQEIWDTLESEFAPKKFAHQMNLKRQLHNLHKATSGKWVFSNPLQRPSLTMEAGFLMVFFKKEGQKMNWYIIQMLPLLLVSFSDRVLTVREASVCASHANMSTYLVVLDALGKEYLEHLLSSIIRNCSHQRASVRDGYLTLFKNKLGVWYTKAANFVHSVYPLLGVHISLVMYVFNRREGLRYNSHPYL